MNFKELIIVSIILFALLAIVAGIKLALAIFGIILAIVIIWKVFWLIVEFILS